MTTTKPTVLNENDDSNDQAERHQPAVVEDEYTGRVENDLLRVKEALGIDDDDYCMGILDQLYDSTRIGHYGDTDFNFALSKLKDAKKPADKFYVSLLVKEIACDLAAKRLLKVASEPVQLDVLPDDMAWALCYGKDVSTLPKRFFKIQNQSVIESSIWGATRLMETQIKLLEAANRYQAAVDSAINVQKVSRRRATRRDCGHLAATAVSKNAIAVSPQRLNGKAQCAVLDTTKLSTQRAPARGQKRNGHAPA
jgi:hypothetical protein